MGKRKKRTQDDNISLKKKEKEKILYLDEKKREI